MRRAQVRIKGLVQGVGFRPFIYGLAVRLGLAGWVLNDGAGVSAEVQGAVENVGAFLIALRIEAPPLARIDKVEASDLLPDPALSGFVIRHSEAAAGAGSVLTGVAPDAAVCPACLAELFDPQDRRYRYPFLNCTHCGPRYTITRRLPYDRPQTSMAGFPLCADCAGEYADPGDRRFHAQPVACPVCGPKLSHTVEEVLGFLQAGKIVALKGLGGFHLACDARNGAAVGRLRRVKQRNAKPFAIMVAGAASAARFVALDDDERALLQSPARPVVVGRRREDGPELSPDIAPGLAWLGVMLPYTPLHYLLFHEAAGRPVGLDWLETAQELTLVMTSANPGGEPLAIGNEEAARRLAGIADVLVDHDRDIVIRADDSVMRKLAGAPAFLRRARGFVPAPIKLSRPQPPTLAVGGHLKNAVCVTRGDEAFLSQHIGDLDNAATLGFFEETINHLLHVLDVTPQIVAHDLHPDFLSTRYAEGSGIPCVAVQHHHAHIAAVLAEHQIDGPAAGLALDGFGLGADGGAWGGELLLVMGGRFERLGRLAQLAQPGGDVAARQPWRMAAAALHRMGRADEIPVRFSASGPADGVRRMLDKGLNAPLTSSCGRWFDAACGLLAARGLLGLRATAGYEGEAPMALESLVRRPFCDGEPWRIDGGALDLTPLLERLLSVESAEEGADLFHGGLIAALIAWTLPELRARGLDFVVLSGGCLMNAVLAEGLAAGFAAAGVRVLLPRLAPANDGGLALGQAWAAGRGD
jgi:hydrogenase maturation protein HypF